MTNREKYKQTFSTLHVSDNFSLEVEKMEQTTKHYRYKTMLGSIIACVMLVGSTATAYATDFCGIQRTLQLWIEGDQTEVTIELSKEGTYNMEYTDDEGNLIQQGGGGVAINEDGSESPLTEEELLDLLDDPDVRYEDDGTVLIYYYDQIIDITDKFEDGVCYAKVSNGKETLYMTIEYQNGWSSSPTKYLSPSMVN